MVLGIFDKMRESVHRKIETGDPSLYVSMAFPILVAFIITFVGSRIVGYLITYGIIPEIYWQPSQGLHVHHFTYGVFILFIAGYLGLVIKDARAKFWTAMLLGLGLGLAMDEFGMWLRLDDAAIVRWSYDGFNITIGLFLFILTAKPGFKMLKRLWPGSLINKSIGLK
jgi:hypothetical protein